MAMMQTRACTVLPASVQINGAAVRHLRKMAGHNLQPFAAMAEISWGYLSQIERGTRPGVSPDVFARIANALGLPIERRHEIVRADAQRIAA